MKKSKKLALVIACLLFSSASIASPITIKLEGMVYSIDPIFSSLVSWGDPMTASFIYDPSLITFSREFDPDRYFYYSPLVEYEVSMGNIYAYGTGGRSEVTNNYIDENNRLWDRFILQTGGVSYPSIPALENLALENRFEINALSVSMTLYDFIDADALTTSEALQTIPLESFDMSQSAVSIQMEVAGGEFDWQPMFARIQSAEIVPIPPSVWLFASGLLGLIGTARKKALTQG
ncbi:MAG: hypothetical protein ACQ9ET_03380 [Nitrosomonadaceae bacterium]